MTTYSAITNSEIAVGAPVTNNLKTKERDNLLAIQENDASAPTIAFATEAGTAGTASTITSQGDLATLDTVSQTEIDAAAVGQAELKTSTVENSLLKIGAVTDSTLDVTVTNAEYPLGGAAKSSNTARTSNFRVTGQIEGVITDSVSYVASGFKWTLTYDTSDSVTVYIRGRYISSSPPYIGEDGLMHLFVYCKFIDGVLSQIHVCDDPPWRQPEYKKIKGIKTINSVSRDNAGIPEITGREMVMGDKFTHMNETPHPFGALQAGETAVMLDPISDVMKRLHEIHTSGESVGELIHDGTVAIGNKITRYAPNGIKVVSVKWK